MRAIDLLVGPPSLDRRLPTRPSEDRRACCGAAPHGDNIAPARPRETARTGGPPTPGRAVPGSSNGGDDRWPRQATSLAALVRAAAAPQRPDAPAVVAGDQRLTWARARRRRRPRRRRVRRARPGAGRPGRRPAAQRPRLAARRPRRAARRAGRRPGQHRLHRPRARVRARRLRRRAAGRRGGPASRSAASGSAPGRPTATARRPRSPEDPRAPGLPRLHQRHDRSPARRDPDRRRAAGQPGAVPGA